MVKGAVWGDVGGAGLGFGTEQGRHRMVQAWGREWHHRRAEGSGT